jgi:hypothetical protein
MSNTKQPAPFRPGQMVFSTYRIPPFYSDEALYVVNATNIGTKRKPLWRVYVQSAKRPQVQGWQYGTDLVEIRQI